MNKSTVLRRQLESGEMIVAPGCQECVSAKCIEMAGFKTAYMTGWGTEAVHGYPDIGMLTADEMINNAKRIANSIKIPLISDADTGFGSALNVWRTVQDYIRAGVAGIHIEDQEMPKKCGALTGRRVIPIEEAVGKFKAAVAARDEMGSDMLIIARSDAQDLGVDELIKRLKIYTDIPGVDVGMGASGTVDQMKKIVKAVKRPLLSVYSEETAQYKMMTIKDYEEIGIRILLFPTHSIRISMKAYLDFWGDVKKHGTITTELGQRVYPFADSFKLVGLPLWSERATTYIPGAEEIVPSKRAMEIGKKE